VTRKSGLPDYARPAIDEKARNLVETVLKPRLVIDEPHKEYNFVIDVVTRWRGSSVYFISIYRVGSRGDVPGDTFEAPFARMQYKAGDLFGLSYMRHTGKWEEVYPGLSVEECLESIRDDPFFAG
jgi:hypothetical protein